MLHGPNKVAIVNLPQLLERCQEDEGLCRLGEVRAELLTVGNGELMRVGKRG